MMPNFFLSMRVKHPERFEIQARKKVYNFPFLMGQGVWLDSEKLGWTDEVREVLKHGTLSVGFIGLAETLVAPHVGDLRLRPLGVVVLEIEGGVDEGEVGEEPLGGAPAGQLKEIVVGVTGVVVDAPL